MDIMPGFFAAMNALKEVQDLSLLAEPCQSAFPIL